LRYRTGDLVRSAKEPCPCGRTWLRLEGGILGRTDDMISIRGNNLYPAVLENILRRFDEVEEYRVEVDSSSGMAELRIEIEPRSAVSAELGKRIEQALRDELLFRADVKIVPPNTLPRFEMKAQRIKKK
jgi:phenylacetate-CoA ligase